MLQKKSWANYEKSSGSLPSPHCSKLSKHEGAAGSKKMCQKNQRQNLIGFPTRIEFDAIGWKPL